MKLIFDPDDGTILGAQIVGRNGVDKRIDVIATAMASGMSADQLADLELAYAPPFSSAKDPVNLLGYMAENILSGDCDVVAADELAGLIDAGWSLVDVRTAEENERGAIEGSTQCADRLDCETISMRWAAARWSSTAKSASGDTPPRPCCMSSDLRPAISTAGTRRGARRCGPVSMGGPFQFHSCSSHRTDRRTWSR